MHSLMMDLEEQWLKIEIVQDVLFVITYVSIGKDQDSLELSYVINVCLCVYDSCWNIVSKYLKVDMKRVDCS